MDDKKNKVGDTSQPDYANDQLGENETEHFKRDCGCGCDTKSGKSSK